MAGRYSTKAVNGVLLKDILSELNLKQKQITDPPNKGSDEKSVCLRNLQTMVGGGRCEIDKIGLIAERISAKARKMGRLEFGLLIADDLLMDRWKKIEDFTIELYERRSRQKTALAVSLEAALEKATSIPERLSGLRKQLSIMENSITEILLGFPESLDDPGIKEKLASALEQAMWIADMETGLIVKELRLGSVIVVAEVEIEDAGRLARAFEEGRLDHLGLLRIAINTTRHVVRSIPSNNVEYVAKGIENWRSHEWEAAREWTIFIRRPPTAKERARRLVRRMKSRLAARNNAATSQPLSERVYGVLSAFGVPALVILFSTGCFRIVENWAAHATSKRESQDWLPDNYPHVMMSIFIMLFCCYTAYLMRWEQPKLSKLIGWIAVIMSILASLNVIFLQ